MCKKCLQKQNDYSLPYLVVSTNIYSNCTNTLESILEYKERLKCLDKKIKLHEQNKLKGFIDTMLIQKNYCKYDLSFFEDILIKHGC